MMNSRMARKGSLAGRLRCGIGSLVSRTDDEAIPRVGAAALAFDGAVVHHHRTLESPRRPSADGSAAGGSNQFRCSPFLPFHRRLTTALGDLWIFGLRRRLAVSRLLMYRPFNQRTLVFVIGRRFTTFPPPQSTFIDLEAMRESLLASFFRFPHVLDALTFH